jgi:hypothetical protein
VAGESRDWRRNVQPWKGIAALPVGARAEAAKVVGAKQLQVGFSYAPSSGGDESERTNLVVASLLRHAARVGGSLARHTGIVWRQSRSWCLMYLTLAAACDSPGDSDAKRAAARSAPSVVLESPPAGLSPAEHELAALLDGTSPRLRKGIDELRPESTTPDGRGEIVYAQYYKGVRVYDSALLVSFDPTTKKRVGVSGRFGYGIDLSVTPAISETQATRTALTALGLDAGQLGEHSVELLLYPAHHVPTRWRLAWVVKVKPPLVAVVDAQTGTILFQDRGIRR